ncbi:MAG TPA: hypothetical protein VIR16_05525 [Candidatus Limnocylindrales bacterium]
MMKDASAALRHARGDMAEAARHAGEDLTDAARHASEDIADAARQIGAEASRQIRANAAAAGEELVDTARQISADASRQVRRNAAAARKEAERQVRRNAAMARKEAKRQIKRNAAAARATASTIPDELIPAGVDAIRKSVEKMTPGRKRSRRGPVLGVLAVLACTGLAFLGVQFLLMRRSTLRMPRRRGWGQSADGSMTSPGSTTVDDLGMAGTIRTTPTTGLGDASQPSVAEPIGISRRTGLPNGQRRPADAVPDATTEPAALEPGTFDRDAGIRAATEGMAPPEPLTPASPPSEIADGT